MKFMTPATLRNLPNYMADQRQRSLLNREEERYQEEKNSRKKFAEFASRIMDVTMNAKSKDELYSGFDKLKSEYSQWLTPEMMQAGATAVRQWQEDQYKQEDRTRQEVERKTRSADADASSRLLGRMTGIFPNQEASGGDEYSVPVSQKDLFLSTSPENRLGLLDKITGIKSGQAEAQRQAEKDAVEMDYKRAQTQNLLNPKPDKPPTSYQEWVLAGKPGTYEQWTNRGRSGRGGEDAAWEDLMAKYQVDETTRTAMVQKGDYNTVKRDIESLGFSVFPGEPVKVDRPGWFTGNDEMIEVRIGGYRGGSPQTAQPETDQYQQAAEIVTQMDPMDAAERMLDLPEDDMAQVLSLLPPDKARQILADMRRISEPAQEAPRGDVVPPGERRSVTPPLKQDRLAPAKDVAGAVTRGLKPVGEGIDAWIRRIQK